jgi:hypothetical protein
LDGIYKDEHPSSWLTPSSIFFFPSGLIHSSNRLISFMLRLTSRYINCSWCYLGSRLVSFRSFVGSSLKFLVVSSCVSHFSRSPISRYS